MTAMREIKFRGKSVRDNVWIFGDLITAVGGTDIRVYSLKSDLDAYHVPVDPDTVGQSTGLRDADGREIYEGDIVKISSESSRIYHYPAVVIWQEAYARFAVISQEILWRIPDSQYIIVIGNIHDNPYLVGVSHDHSD